MREHRRPALMALVALTACGGTPVAKAPAPAEAGRPVEGLRGFYSLGDATLVDGEPPAALTAIAPIAPACAKGAKTSAVYRLDADVYDGHPGPEEVYVSLGRGVVVIAGDKVIARQHQPFTDCAGSQSELHAPWATQVVADGDVEIGLDYVEGGQRVGSSRFAIVKRRKDEAMVAFDEVTDQHEDGQSTPYTIERKGAAIVVTAADGSRSFAWNQALGKFVAP